MTEAEIYYIFLLSVIWCLKYSVVGITSTNEMRFTRT